MKTFLTAGYNILEILLKKFSTCADYSSLLTTLDALDLGPSVMDTVRLDAIFIFPMANNCLSAHCAITFGFSQHFCMEWNTVACCTFYLFKTSFKQLKAEE